MSQSEGKVEIREVNPDYVPNISSGSHHHGHDLLEKEAVIDHDFNPKWLQNFQRFRDKYYLNVFFAEMLGSFIFLYFLLMSLGGLFITNGVEGSFGFSVYSLGASVALALYIIAPISGGHISPPITMIMCMFRKFPLKMVPIYIIAQLIGALLATIFVFAIAENQLTARGVSPRPPTVASIYSPVFNGQLPIGIAILNELVGDTLFMFIAVAVTDLRNPLIKPSLGPALVGVNLFVCANAFGWSYWTLNPLRDIIPRAYASQTYSGLFDHGFWAVALFMPFLGHFLGAVLYETCAAKVYKVPVTDSRANHHIN